MEQAVLCRRRTRAAREPHESRTRAARRGHLDIGRVPRDRASMFMTFLSVALGGAIGASLRFGAGLWVVRMASPSFPVAVLSVNVVGSFVMGAFAVWSLERGYSALNPFVMTGILGGFTTFSAFSFETLMLIERGQALTALLYIALSVGLSVGALGLGLWLMRGALA